METPRRRLLLVAEIVCLALGVAGLAWLGLFHFWVATETKRELEHFTAARELRLPPVPSRLPAARRISLSGPRFA